MLLRARKLAGDFVTKCGVRGEKKTWRISGRTRAMWTWLHCCSNVLAKPLQLARACATRMKDRERERERDKQKNIVRTSSERIFTPATLDFSFLFVLSGVRVACVDHDRRMIERFPVLRCFTPHGTFANKATVILNEGNETSKKKEIVTRPPPSVYHSNITIYVST